MAERALSGGSFAFAHPPGHVRGVHEGNQRDPLRPDSGLFPQGNGASANGRRSTGINPKAEDPILPDSPRLSPA